MRSLMDGSLSATTQVKVSSPEILHIAQGQGFHILETNTGTLVKGESVTGVPGSKSVAGRRIDCIGTWENRIVPFRSLQGVEEATRRYVNPVVGLIHSRGVDRVISVEIVKGSLEGISIYVKRDEEMYAIH